MAMNPAVYPAYGVMQGEAAQTFPLEKTFGMEGQFYGQNVDRKFQDGTEDAITRSCTTFTSDCFGGIDIYGSNQDPAMVDRTGCRVGFNDCMVDMETIDTVVDTCSLPENDFNNDHFDMYVTANDAAVAAAAAAAGAGGRCFTPGSGGVLRTVKTNNNNNEEGRTDIVRPIIRLKSASEVATPQNEDYKRYGNQVRMRPIPQESMDTLRQTRISEFTNNLEDFMRSSGQLYRPMGKNAPQTTPDLNRVKLPGAGGYDVPMNTPTAVWGADKRCSHPTTVSNRSAYFFGPDVPTCESELFFTPTLSNRGAGMCNNYTAAANYCVYVGSDSNAISCSCNMLRPCGGNCHVSGCHVVTSELEPSTEHWPVSGSSYLQSLVKRLDRVVECYKGTSPVDNTGRNFQGIQMKAWQQTSRGPYGCTGSQETVVSRSSDYGKWAAASLSTEYAASHEDTTCPEYYVQTSYEDSPYDTGMVPSGLGGPLKQRKTNRAVRSDYKNEMDPPSRNEYGRFVPVRGTSPASSPETPHQYTTPKPSKKNANPATTSNGEKVSGVWYDTNRHLWRVVYMKGNKRKTQGFSSIKLGYEEARRKAIEMRHEMVVLRRADKI